MCADCVGRARWRWLRLCSKRQEFSVQAWHALRRLRRPPDGNRLVPAPRFGERLADSLLEDFLVTRDIEVAARDGKRRFEIVGFTLKDHGAGERAVTRFAAMPFLREPYFLQSLRHSVSDFHGRILVEVAMKSQRKIWFRRFFRVRGKRSISPWNLDTKWRFH
jgi:hypothetical protein